MPRYAFSTMGVNSKGLQYCKDSAKSSNLSCCGFVFSRGLQWCAQVDWQDTREDHSGLFRQGQLSFWAGSDLP